MFNRRAKAIKKIEDILLLAKKRDPAKYDSSEDKHIVVDAYNAMSEIEKNEYIELIPYLYHFMEDRDEYLREKAIRSFGNFKPDQAPELRDKLLKIWSNKAEDSDVRFSAMSLWKGFYRNSKNKEVLKLSYKLLNEQGEKLGLRIKAIITILSVAGELSEQEGTSWFYKLIKLESVDGYNEDEFNAAVNWDKINKIMREYAPEVLKSDT